MSQGHLGCAGAPTQVEARAAAERYPLPDFLERQYLQKGNEFLQKGGVKSFKVGYLNQTLWFKMILSS